VITFLGTVLTFLLMGVITNSLIQRWQQRNWLQQHRVLGAEKAFLELKRLVDELMTLGDARAYRSTRLVRNLSTLDQATIVQVKKEYDQALTAWNDKLNSFIVRLTVYGSYDFAQQLEDDVQLRFFRISEKLDGAVLAARGNKPLPSGLKSGIESELRSLNYRLFRLSRDLLNLLLQKQREAYVGRTVQFREHTIELFSTWYLFKALLKTNQPPQSIIGSSSDFNVPTFFRM